MNHKKIIIGLLVFLAIAIIVLFVTGANAKKKQQQAAEANNVQNGNSSTTPATPAANTPAVASVNSFPIVYGNKAPNELVKELQKALGVTEDGLFGRETLAAIQKWYDAKYTNAYTIQNLAQLTTVMNAIATNKAKATSVGGSIISGGVFNYNNAIYKL